MEAYNFQSSNYDFVYILMLTLSSYTSGQYNAF